MDDLLRGSVAQPSFRATLVGSFSALALLLAMVGLGGVVAYSVRQRTREIGVRMSLGATPRSVALLVLRDAARLAVVGALAGVLAGLVAADALRSMVFGVDVRDPWTLAAAPLLAILVAIGVSWLPARRAARVDPLKALSE